MFFGELNTKLSSTRVELLPDYLYYCKPFSVFPRDRGNKKIFVGFFPGLININDLIRMSFSR